ncbi:hypothetical protein [Rosenbergiella australiborealis]|uniref:Biofilm development protein YmgB/AriR n=1 Tax=Rosenbergiella australiborealis TaxID=1544696 RepID=A0ABS5T6C9_9GAMM|nr:hypothetical protein [Rosenbergiella australiborealis]MBT0727913.1 hypothetical protein [Rosenbergiella australiborealis]
MRQQTYDLHLAKRNGSSAINEQLSNDQLMGMLIVELLESGKTLNRKSICTKLMNWIELAENDNLIKRYQDLMLLVLDRELN